LLQKTEYLKLIKQYLSQARELRQFAGDNETLDVPTCESEETAQLLKTLGYRLQNECGSNVVLETVNPSRAFLSIDSAFPLTNLEDAYRRDVAFHQPYGVTKVPVLFGPGYWREVQDSEPVAILLTSFCRIPPWLGCTRRYRRYIGRQRLRCGIQRQSKPSGTTRRSSTSLAEVLRFKTVRQSRQEGPLRAPSGGNWREYLLIGVPRSSKPSCNRTTAGWRRTSMHSRVSQAQRQPI
jgi:hypothetical protein